MFGPGAEGTPLRMRSVIIWRLSAAVSPHGSGTERETVSMRDRLLRGSNRLIDEDWALETALQVCKGSRTINLHVKCSLRRTECGFLDSLPGRMAVPGNAMKTRRADWETAAPRYHRHGGGQGWILLESSPSGSVFEDPGRAARLCRAVPSTRGCGEDGFHPAPESHQQIRKPPAPNTSVTTVTTESASVWICVLGLTRESVTTKLPAVSWW